MTSTCACTRCKKQKDLHADFYVHKGYRRKVCKTCIILQVEKYQEANPQAKFKASDRESRLEYFRAYYRANRTQYAHHRASFLARHPDYYKAFSPKPKLKTGTLELRTQKERKHG
jgi:hypothetical protein